MARARSWHIISSAAAAFSLGAAVCAFSGQLVKNLPNPSRRPSVLLITLDTTRADHLGCYGYRQIETPVIDLLAAEGVRFEHAYVQVPITLPSHAVILTGTYPMFNGVRDFTSPGLPGTIPTLAEILRRNGYRTAAFVSSFVLNSMWGLNRGFEFYDDDVGGGTSPTRDIFLLERRGDQTVARLLDWLNRRDRKPFFIWLHLYDPHSPYRPPEPYRTKYAGHLYDGEIAFDDAQLGKLIARLRLLGVYESTLIVLVGDHGESLGEHRESEHGFFIYNATLRVPLILKLPAEEAKGRVVTQPVGTVDLASTIAQACQIPSEQTRSFQGRSLLGAIKQNDSKEHKAVYAESFYPRNSFGWHELRAVVTPELKYIDAPRAELYNIRTDPSEHVNVLATDSALAGSLREKLLDFDKKFRGRGSSSPPVPLDPETLEKLRSLGYVAYQAGNLGNFVDHQRADPKDKIATLNRVLRAGDLTRLGQWGEADQLLERLEQEEPDLYVVPFQRGENYLSWGTPQVAVEEFRKTLARNPTFDQAALGLGRAYFMLGQDGQAATALELALRFNPRNFLARLALAKVYWRANQLEKAESQLVQVVEAHPGYAEAHADYGVILAKRRKYREAVQEIRKGLELGYRDAIVYNYLGIAFAELGEHAKAIDAYEQSVGLNPRYAAAYLNLALEFRQQSQLAKAQTYYRKACELSERLCRQYAAQFSTSK